MKLLRFDNLDLHDYAQIGIGKPDNSAKVPSHPQLREGQEGLKLRTASAIRSGRLLSFEMLPAATYTQTLTAKGQLASK